jgi:hypothetical protein
MKYVRAILVAVILGLMIPAGGFAQRGGGNDNRPPKEQPRVKDKDKDKPPPSNGNRNRP